MSFSFPAIKMYFLYFTSLIFSSYIKVRRGSREGFFIFFIFFSFSSILAWASECFKSFQVRITRILEDWFEKKLTLRGWSKDAWSLSSWALVNIRSPEFSSSHQRLISRVPELSLTPNLLRPSDNQPPRVQ